MPKKVKVKVELLSRVRLFATPWTVTHQAPLSMGLFQGNWSGLSFPPPGDLADLGSENMSPALKMDSLVLSNCVCVCVCVCVHVHAHTHTLSHVRLCDPMDCSLPGSSVHGTLQARVLEWVAISFSRRSSRPRNQTWVSCIAG